MHKENQFHTEPIDTSRRRLLKIGLLASAACLMPLPAWSRLLASEARSLSLLNTHTDEYLRKIVYWEQGRYLPEALQEINYLLRDHRSNDVHPIDPAALDLLVAVSEKLETDRPYQIISGYRSPQTNNELRKKSIGVAKNSYHMQGKAVDLRIQGVALKNIRRAALNLRAGGVGYYPSSGFVHLDSGRVRSW